MTQVSQAASMSEFRFMTQGTFWPCDVAGFDEAKKQLKPEARPSLSGGCQNPSSRTAHRAALRDAPEAMIIRLLRNQLLQLRDRSGRGWLVKARYRSHQAGAERLPQAPPGK